MQRTRVGPPRAAAARPGAVARAGRGLVVGRMGGTAASGLADAVIVGVLSLLVLLAIAWSRPRRGCW
ncbi:MAG: hypothetical protein R2713_03850 [Ilumatobacteraceae bacterium]